MVSLADALVVHKTKKLGRLEEINKLVRWQRYEYRLKKIVSRSGLGPQGYNVLQLFKILLLQNLYGLSDPDMEEMLYDRLSFRRFCDFGLTDKIPDETTICRFRNALQNQTGKLFGLVMEDIQAHGIKLSGGTIIDATVIKSSTRPPSGGEVSPKDPEAGWTKKGGEYIHGYKGHVSSDSQTGLVKSVIATSADIHDSQVFGQLLDGSEEVVYADKAYGSKEHRDLLKDNSIKDCLMYKAQKGKRQPQWQIQLNKIWGRTRSGVERIFAHWKGLMGLTQSRYKSWGKVQTHFDLIAMVYNLNRTVSLLRKARG